MIIISNYQTSVSIRYCSNLIVHNILLIQKKLWATQH